MDNFKAFMVGIKQDGVIHYHKRVSPTQFGVPGEFGQAFRLGLELNACWQMVRSANNPREFAADIQEYNDYVKRINMFFEDSIVEEITANNTSLLFAVDPVTKEKQKLEFLADTLKLKP